MLGVLKTTTKPSELQVAGVPGWHDEKAVMGIGDCLCAARAEREHAAQSPESPPASPHADRGQSGA